eukprot:COSAG01_NODE_892_length_12895_cov_10.276446_11_plen_134_part_00
MHQPAIDQQAKQLDEPDTQHALKPPAARILDGCGIERGPCQQRLWSSADKCRGFRDSDSADIVIASTSVARAQREQLAQRRSAARHLALAVLSSTAMSALQSCRDIDRHMLEHTLVPNRRRATRYRSVAARAP